MVSNAAVAQLAARRSHTPEVVSSILTCRILQWQIDAGYRDDRCMGAQGTSALDEEHGELYDMLVAGM